MGGGLSGVGAAHALARAGYHDVTVIESGARLGGLAGSFVSDGRFYPLGYHHILHRDRTLLYFLERLGLASRVRWRRVRMLFQRGAELYDLASPRDFLRFPLPPLDKLRFVRLMALAALRADWRAWDDRDAAALIDRFASPRVRQELFEPLTRLKFQLPCHDVSAAWLGARLHHREGAAPLGYIPHSNWTTELCDGLTDLLGAGGVTVRTGRRVVRLHADGGRAREAELDDGTRVRGDVFISALPLEVYRQLAPQDDTPEVRSIRYTALLSAICATDQTVSPEFYWLNLSSLGQSACAIFVLSNLNPTIGHPGETCLNFVTHLGRDQAMFAESDDQIMARYHADFRALFGFDLRAKWTRLVRVPMYSPVFGSRYRNPPVQSTALPNVYFTGNYRNHPCVASTGTALASGLDTAGAVLARHGAGTGARVDDEVRRFRPRAGQRAS
ncbi:MAG TPA: FAD-dependent oxidoreductase [Polyangia bacterium]|nr:FAD-dependent oxidoreductase [Polyangia bacterium]